LGLIHALSLGSNRY